MTLPPLTYGRTARRCIAVLIALTALLVLPATSGADTITSNNWSGYAAHGHGAKFRRITATWRQPAAICATGTQTYSAFWVGIGGYSLSSDAMEQIGSELDCSADGTESLSAWYELLPAPSRTIRITIAGGDLITAGVNIAGHRVTLTLDDTTRHEEFAKTVTDHKIDDGSAEWIAEAPSDCSTATTCETLTLTDFGAVQFANASAETTTGRTASISSSLWTSTKILLGYSSNGTSFVAKTSTATATPLSLTGSGRAFRVDYSGASATTTTGSGGTGSTGTGSGSGAGSGSGTGAGTGSGTGTGSGAGSGTGSGAGGFPGAPGGGPGGGGQPPFGDTYRRRIA
jgi:hypothetical protein